MGEDFENFLENRLIDRYLRCKKFFDEELGEEYYEKYIRLSDIDRLNLNEEEVDFIFKYLEKQDIKVYGSYQCYVGIYDNYRLKCRAHNNKNKRDIFSSEEKMREYQKTRDINLRNEIVEANLQLVKFLAGKYSSFFKVDYSILESYGYEGLIKAVERFDFSKGKFKSFVSSYTKMYISNGAIVELLGSRSLVNKLHNQNKNSNYFEYFYTLSSVEEEEFQSIKDNPDIIKIVMKKLKEKGYGNPKKLKELEVSISEKNSYSLEQLGEDLIFMDNDSLYSTTIEELFQEEFRQKTGDFLNIISDRQKYIIISTFQQNKKTLQQMGKELKIARQRVGELRKQALKTLENSSNKEREILNLFLRDNNHEYSGPNNYAYIKRRKDR